jgi:hypothetical protein
MCLNETTIHALLDGELSPRDTAAARSHLAHGPGCTERVREAQEIEVLIDDAWRTDLPPAVPTLHLRARIESKLSQAPAPATVFQRRFGFLRWQYAAAALLLVAAVIGALAPRIGGPMDAPPAEIARAPEPGAPLEPPAKPVPVKPLPEVVSIAVKDLPKEPPAVPSAHVSAPRPVRKPARTEPETNRHLAQTQLLLRSVRNAEDLSDLDYERALAAELLSRNRLLRRLAQQKQDMRTERLLSGLEPLLLDISNIMSRPQADEMHSLQELIRDQHIIAELQLYAGRGGF